MKVLKDFLHKCIIVFMLLVIVQGCSMVHMKATSASGHTADLKTIKVSGVTTATMEVADDIKVLNTAGKE